MNDHPMKACELQADESPGEAITVRLHLDTAKLEEMVRDAAQAARAELDAPRAYETGFLDELQVEGGPRRGVAVAALLVIVLAWATGFGMAWVLL